MGSILGYIAVVVGIGTMVGEILLVSGGAKQIAGTLLSRSGEKRAPQALALIGFIVAIPVFFEVALILFIPLVYDLTGERANPSSITGFHWQQVLQWLTPLFLRLRAL